MSTLDHQFFLDLLKLCQRICYVLAGATLGYLMWRWWQKHHKRPKDGPPPPPPPPADKK